MSWEVRHGRRYYYQVRRHNGVLRKRYVGKDLPAFLDARQDEQRRQEQASDLQQRRELESQLWSVEQRTRLIQQSCQTILQAVYLAAGYRQSSSRNWRKEPKVDRKKKPKKRKKKKVNPPPEQGNENADQLQKAAVIPRTFLETVSAIKGGVPGLMGNLRWFLEQAPDVYRCYGDLTAMTKTAWVRHLGHNDPVITTSILMRANEELEELLGESPTPAQRLLGERVIVSKMQLAFYEQCEAAAATELSGGKLSDWIARRVKSANFQFQQAISQLQTLRRLEDESNKTRLAGALRLYDPERKTA